MMDQKELIEIRTPQKTATNTADDKFILSIEFAMDKKSSDDNSEAVQRGNRAKLNRGHDYRRHLGYMFVEDPQTGEKLLQPDPDRFELIKKAVHLILGGMTPMRALEILNDDWLFRTRRTRRTGGKPLSPSGFYKLLNESFYCGFMKNGDGEEIIGSHTPMLKEYEFEKLQEILGSKGRPRPRTLTLPYRGLIFCGECQCTVCLEEKHQLICDVCKQKFAYRHKTECPACGTPIEKMKNPKKLKYIYAGCTKRKKAIKCRQRSIRLEDIDTIIKDYLFSIELSPKVHEFLLQKLEEDLRKEMGNDANERQRLQRLLNETEEQLNGLTIQFTSVHNTTYDLISPEEYKTRKQGFVGKKKQIEKLMRKLSSQIDAVREQGIQTFNFAVTAKQRFDEGDMVVRTSIIHDLGPNLELKDRKITIDQEKAFYFIRKRKEEIRTISTDALEPEKSIDLYAQTGIVTPIISSLQGCVEDVRTYFLNLNLQSQ